MRMLSRKPAVLFCSYANLPSFCYTPAHSCTSCRRTRRQARAYAQHASDAESQSQSQLHSNGQGPDLSWPEPFHPHTTPSPYQILAARRGEAYSKHRFYSLAKLYHPDGFHPSSPIAHLPRAVRLERYRLLVAAHAILSDETKRRAYDLWGSGWSELTRAREPPHHGSSARPNWPSGHDPMMNATWEDWEHWYEREYRRQRNEAPRAVYMSNFGFISVVFALVTLGGIMQGTRANMLSSSVMEHRDRVHKEASTELLSSKQATMTDGRKERIKTFLEHREANLTGEEAHEPALPPPLETCSPDSIRRQ